MGASAVPLRKWDDISSGRAAFDRLNLSRKFSTPVEDIMVSGIVGMRCTRLDPGPKSYVLRVTCIPSIGTWHLDIGNVVMA